MKNILLIPLASFALLGCGSSYYILSDIHPQSVQKTLHTTIGVEQVDVPKYLFKRELAYISNNSNEVIFDSNIQWAEDMNEALTRRVIGSLQQKFKNPNIYPYPWGMDTQPDIKLHINITRFIAKGNKVYLQANYRIENLSNHKIKSYLFDTVVATDTNKYQNIVNAMDIAFEKLIGDISQKIQY